MTHPTTPAERRFLHSPDERGVIHILGGEGLWTLVAEHDRGLAVLGLPGSALLRCAVSAGLVAVPEAFADRRYTAAGGLVPRSKPGALLTDPELIADQVRRLVIGPGVIADDGSVLPVKSESICVHGDTPGAVQIARTVRSVIEAAGWSVRPFTGARTS